MTNRRRLPWPSLLILVAGCGGEDWRADTYPTTGKITINGELPAGALVQLHPMGNPVDERHSRPWGKVRADGTYNLTTYDDGEGAPVGEYAITVTWPAETKSAFPPDRLRGRYAAPEKSEWKATIEEGENELPTIAISGAEIDATGAGPGGRGGPPMMPGRRKDGQGS